MLCKDQTLSSSYNAVRAQTFLACCATAMLLPSFSAFCPTMWTRMLFSGNVFALHPATMLYRLKFFQNAVKRLSFYPHSQHFAVHLVAMLCKLKVFWNAVQRPCFFPHFQNFALLPAIMLCRLKFFRMMCNGHLSAFISAFCPSHSFNAAQSQIVLG